MGTIRYPLYHIVISVKDYKGRIEDALIQDTLIILISSKTMCWPSVMITSFSKFWDIMSASVWVKKEIRCLGSISESGFSENYIC